MNTSKLLRDLQDAYQIKILKKGGWIQKATASIKRRGTEGVCTGAKFGGPTCPPGSKRYTLAKTFKKMARNRKKDNGGKLKYLKGGEITKSPEKKRLLMKKKSELNVLLTPNGIVLDDFRKKLNNITKKGGL